MKKILFFLLVCFIGISLIACNKQEKQSGTQDETVVLEFSQWWAPELPENTFRALMDQFEVENPGIKVKLISGPYASTKEQSIAGAATGTMADVVGLDGAWVSDFVKQGAITSLSTLMSSANYNDSELAAQIAIDGETYMIPVVNFIYPLFINTDILSKSGINSIPATRSEFFDTAKAVTSGNTYGWALPLKLEVPNGVQNDVMSWVWASGGTMLKNGKPDLLNDDIRSAVLYIKELYDAGVIAPGAFTMAEQDKVEEFVNGRVAMTISSLAHINQIREKSPDLNFAIAALPSADSYTGKRGIPYASWGIGVSENSDHKQEAWKLVSFLMSKDVNSKLSSIANAFPGNIHSVPDFVTSDELFGKAFEVFQEGYVANEFVGLPVAEQLMRIFASELQKYLDGQQTLDEMLHKAQDAWVKEFN